MLVGGDALLPHLHFNLVPVPLLPGVVLGGRAPASPSTVVPVFSDADGIQVVSTQRFDDRDYNVVVRSAALGRAVNVRVLLPSGYAPTSGVRYPVLYLFVGTSGLASDWITMGHAAETTAARPLILVMPDIGFDGNGGGWFTDWVDTLTTLGPSQWETFHVNQLIPWVDHNLPTIAARQGRGVAGLSQGGFGSATYAARHPDMFVTAATFSGAPDIDYNPAVAAAATEVIEYTASFLDGVQAEAMFGSRATNEINWQGHDPAQLATNLRGVDLWLYTATGAPGPLDPPVPNPAGTGIETLTHASTMSFYQRLEQLGISSHLDDYVFGTHSFPYWARDLQQYIGPLMQIFANPPGPPQAISYASIDTSWSQWDWSVSLQRAAAQEFSFLSAARPEGFTLTGTGTASVTTPTFYRPKSAHTVTMSGASGHRTSEATADTSGRLQLNIPLGALSPPAVIGAPATPVPENSTTVAIGSADQRAASVHAQVDASVGTSGN